MKAIVMSRTGGPVQPVFLSRGRDSPGRKQRRAMVQALLAGVQRTGRKSPVPRRSAGYEAIVVTLDTTNSAGDREISKGGYLPFLRGRGIANYVSYPVFNDLPADTGLPSPPGASGPP
ncbi:hypothetical protein [Rhizobium binxianense]